MQNSMADRIFVDDVAIIRRVLTYGGIAMNWEQRDNLGKVALAVILIAGTIGAFTGGFLITAIVAIAVVILYWVVWKSDKFDE